MSTPLHAQVADELRARIARGELARGTQLPSEARLSQEFGASRGTIRAALSALRQDGLIGGGQGRPPVVLDSALGQPFDTLLSFSSWCEQMGRQPGQRTVELARRGASEVAASALQIEPGEPVVEILRVRLLDDEPVMLERSTFVLTVGRRLFDADFDIDRNSIYAYLLSQGADLHAARHTFDAVAADAVDADLLGIEVGHPLLRERRLAMTSAGQPVEYSDDRYRPDQVTFTITNSQATPTGAAAGVRVLKENP